MGILDYFCRLFFGSHKRSKGFESIWEFDIQKEVIFISVRHIYCVYDTCTVISIQAGEGF